MDQVRVSTLRDRFHFFLHLGAASALGAGVFWGMGMPLVLGAVALGITGGVQFGLVPAVKKHFQKAIDDENEERKFRRSLVSSLAKLNPWSKKMMSPWALPALDADELRHRKVRGWISQMAAKLKLGKEPDFLIMEGNDKKAEKDSLFGTILREFNKNANAFAFTEKKDNVVLSAPIVDILNDRELKAVVAHEMTHIGANHLGLSKWLSWVSTPARLLTSLNFMVTAFSSFKNAGLFVGSLWLSNMATRAYGAIAGLDKKDDEDKAKLEKFRGYCAKGTLIGLAVGLGAPEILVAMGLNYLNQKAHTLVSKSYSRRNEFHADRGAKELTKDPEALCTGLQKIQAEHVKNKPALKQKLARTEHETGFLSRTFNRLEELHKTHPNVARRCARLMQPFFSSYMPNMA